MRIQDFFFICLLKNLVIYYSRRGQNYVNGNIRELAKGNAEVLAEYITNEIGADIFELDTVQPYSKDYSTCTEEAKKELREKARPQLKKYLDSVAEYKNIFIVGPNWWGIYPMAVYSQLERLDFTGKIVHFVVTHEGSALGGVAKTIRESCRGAIIGESLAVRGSDVISLKEKTEAQVVEWAKKVLPSY